MLFLAVFCGFLAENQREHMVEHRREKKFAQLLLEDLKKDSALLNRRIELKMMQGSRIDSLVYLLSGPALQERSTELYYYAACFDMNLPFYPNDATFQQLKSSGSLRYLRKADLYNSVTQYYSDCSFYLGAEIPFTSKLSLQSYMTKLFDPDKLYSLISVTADIRDAVRFPQQPMQLLSTDKEALREFSYYVRNIKLNNGLTHMLLKGLLVPRLQSLIEAFKKEYSLK